MRANKLDSLDLKHLRVFLVIYRVGSTVDAADELHLSQPAVSRILGKLRELFDDPLFIRGQRGLIPTPRADRLALELPPAIATLERACSEDVSFHPADMKGKLRIALQTPAFGLIAEKLLLSIHEQAPELKYDILNWETATSELIESGEIDIGVNYFSEDVTKQVYQDKVCDDQPCILVRKGHPLSQLKTVKPQQVLKYQICSCVIPGFNMNQALQESMAHKMGIELDVLARSSDLSSLIDYVQQTDMVLGGQKMYAAAYPNKLIMLDIEDADDIWFPIAVYYHQRNRNNPRHQWLANEIKQVINTHMSPLTSRPD